jgi:succinate-semialdehyde dehydrogenase/glutarate-semialdehyde dehydrogenase
MRYIKHINPSNEQCIGKTMPYSRARISKAVKRARTAHYAWKTLPIDDRLNLIGKVVSLITRRSLKLAKLISREMGKPFLEAEGEVLYAVAGMKHQMKIAKETLGSKRISKTTEVWNEPVGIVAAITPWNFPLLMPLEICTSALITGNCILFKPSESSTLIGKELTAMMHEAGIPKDAFQFIPGADATGKALVNSSIDMVAFVGSREAGKHIMAASSKRLHRIVLELGGKDPMIVCKDADLKAAAKAAIWGGMMNAGQVCCSVERIYVEKPVADEFIRRIKKLASRVRVKSKLPAVLKLGPLVNRQQYDNFVLHINDAKKKGAKILVGGSPVKGKGYYFEPTILINVKDNMKIMTEETFGPALPIQVVDDVEEAIIKANALPFGLTASIWTKDKARYKEYASRLEAGAVNINGTGGGDYTTPWGGIKESGMGRLNSKEGLLQFTQTKVVVIK